MSFRRSMCSFEVIGRLRARSEERNYSNMKPIALIRRETDSCFPHRTKTYGSPEGFWRGPMILVVSSCVGLVPSLVLPQSKTIPARWVFRLIPPFANPTNRLLHRMHQVTHNPHVPKCPRAHTWRCGSATWTVRPGWRRPS